MSNNEEKKELNSGCVISIIFGVIFIVLFLIDYFTDADIPAVLLWLMALVPVLIFIIQMSQAENDIRKDMQENNAMHLEKRGLCIADFFNGGKYICGHPKLNEPRDNVKLAVKNNTIYIGREDNYGRIVEIREIAASIIKNITVEDETTIRHRVGVKRLLAVGVFAFAMKKKVVNELAYLTIEWTQGQFSHETIFEFQGQGSLTTANTIRNRLINKITEN